ncbi:hypothetical protein ACFOTA_16545 [Chitinophaga sp. GCM10012297]|uniref:Long-chain fatty acid transport protein n=1 Tax=Chitinophaga chungangae TaxID=2821488 RepID=A0ABS3YGM9_9BACT|nr:hypothetical protein [Chitinophaga chungangae]MBO9153831.1 hypothetical protein [Chitinophaga chungangae]
MRISCLLPLLLTLLPARLSAQDANYWSSSYGPAGYFMPGSVISQNRDSGVMFYNPALLVNTATSTTSISGTIYQYQSLVYPDGIGTGLRLKSQGASIIPMVASRAVPVKKKLPFTLAFAIVHNPVIDYGVTQQKDVVQDVLDNSYSPGPETFIGQYKAANRIDQTAVQLGAGWRAGKKLSLGITAEGVVQRQSFTVDYIARAMMNPAGPDTLLAPITTVSEDYTASYWQVGLRAKLGMAWEIARNHHAGLVFTTPVLKTAGKGTAISNVQISNLYLTPAAGLNLLASSRQAKLPSHWKNPLSIAAGYTYMHRKGQLYVAAEYFAAIKAHSVLQPRPAAFIRPDTGSNATSAEFLQLKDERSAVINCGIGASYLVAEDLTLFASLRTDFSYARKNRRALTEGYNIYITNWDLYHMQLGANMRRKRYNLRTGLMLTYGGTNNYPQTINFDHPNEDNFLLGDPGVTPGRTLQAGVLVSYIHNF